MRLQANVFHQYVVRASVIRKSYVNALIDSSFPIYLYYGITRCSFHLPRAGYWLANSPLYVKWCFTYLSSLINVNNDNSAESKKRILMATKGFYGLKRQFRSQFLSIKNKIKLYKTLIRPVLAYGSETWLLSKSD